MTNPRRLLFGVLMLLSALVLLMRDPEAYAYVEAPHSMGQVVNLSSNVVLMRITAVDKNVHSTNYFFGLDAVDLMAKK